MTEIPVHLELYVLDMAALKGETVCQGHADVCAILGHGKNLRNGVEQGWCPRCGVITGEVFEDCPRGCGYRGRANDDWKQHFEYECPIQPDTEWYVVG